mmetsp:Transcript_5597/g.13048  ORF Transcript_5597/g.13048 Transcript_5597/m.13048 type:complete len:148 (-) Transcript_5597:75-518(-)
MVGQSYSSICEEKTNNGGDLEQAAHNDAQRGRHSCKCLLRFMSQPSKTGLPESAKAGWPITFRVRKANVFVALARRVGRSVQLASEVYLERKAQALCEVVGESMIGRDLRTALPPGLLWRRGGLFWRGGAESERCTSEGGASSDALQ